MVLRNNEIYDIRFISGVRCVVTLLAERLLPKLQQRAVYVSISKQQSKYLVINCMCKVITVDTRKPDITITVCVHSKT